jgi:hypothetical protein
VGSAGTPNKHPYRAYCFARKDKSEFSETCVTKPESVLTASITKLDHKKCLCGIEAAMKTSFTKENFVGRFLGCANYRESTY